mmetsp:Transcript_13990/g.22968  ORF Transcript_13990/g.22968 Transcript_13990/m.22968 type:complete len:270 (-) Transcript_13990:203-1012(-)
MSLRQARDAPADPPDDEEQGLLDNSPEIAPPRPRPSPVAQRQQQQQSSSSASASVMSAFDTISTATSTQNPLMLAKLILRKFLILLTNEEETDPTTTLGYTVALLKDIIIGIVFGFLTISFAIVLDHRNIIHIQSAHHIRESVYASMSDPATLQQIEAEMDMKFMSIKEYEAAKQEIQASQTVFDEVKSKLETREKELEELNTKFQAVVDEKAELMKHPKFAGLDNFCEACSWGGPGSCGARVEYLMNTYNVGKVAAMLDLMGKDKCKK